MSRYVQVEGYTGLVRDSQSNAILNTNAEEIELARERKRLMKIRNQEEIELKNKIQSLEKDVGHIKDSIDLILQKLDR